MGPLDWLSDTFTQKNETSEENKNDYKVCYENVHKAQCEEAIDAWIEIIEGYFPDTIEEIESNSEKEEIEPISYNKLLNDRLAVAIDGDDFPAIKEYFKLQMKGFNIWDKVNYADLSGIIEDIIIIDKSGKVKFKLLTPERTTIQEIKDEWKFSIEEIHWYEPEWYVLIDSSIAEKPDGRTTALEILAKMKGDDKSISYNDIINTGFWERRTGGEKVWNENVKILREYIEAELNWIRPWDMVDFSQKGDEKINTYESWSGTIKPEDPKQFSYYWWWEWAEKWEIPLAPWEKEYTEKKTTGKVEDIIIDKYWNVRLKVYKWNTPWEKRHVETRNGTETHSYSTDHYSLVLPNIAKKIEKKQ